MRYHALCAAILLSLILETFTPHAGFAQPVRDPSGPAPGSETIPALIAPDPTPEAPGECVPETVVTYVPPTSTLVAAFYYAWYQGSAPCPGAGYWCDCFFEPKPGQPRPGLGFYGSDERAIADSHMAQMASHGVNVVAIEWNGKAEEEDNIIQQLIPAVSSRGLKFVLLYDPAIRFGFPLDFDIDVTRGGFVADLRSFAQDSNYFKHPSYLKLKNKPVVYMYLSRAIEGSNANIAAAFDAARQAARDNGFADLYLVGDHLWWQGVDYDKLRLMGAQGMSAFGPVTAERPHSTAFEWVDEMATQLYTPARTDPNALPKLADAGSLVDLSPGIFVQYDDNGFGPGQQCADGRSVQRYHLTAASDWSAMIRTAGLDQRWVAEKTRVGANCRETISTNTDYTSILWIYSFNEWGEGTGMETLESRDPRYPFGFGSEPLEVLGTELQANPVVEPPLAPTPRNPEGTIEGLRPRFAWDGVPFAMTYQLRVQNAGGQAVIDVSLGSESFRPDFDLAGGQGHTWKVRAQNAIGWGPFSQPVAFTPFPVYVDPPTAPDPFGPKGCTGSVRPTFSWQAAARAMGYKIAIYRVSPETLLIYTDVAGTSYRPPISLAANVQHRWKVKAMNSAGETWSKILYFTPGCASLQVGDVSVTEGNSGTTDAAFKVSLTSAKTQTVTVDYATADGSAIGATDYTITSGRLTFAPGTVSRTVRVPVIGEMVYEDDETFFLTLSNPVNADLGDPQGEATIKNDDLRPVLRWIDYAPVSVVEGRSGATQAIFRVRRSRPAEPPLTYYIKRCANTGTATPGVDYEQFSYKSFIFPSMELEAEFGVSIYGDTVPEPTEDFFVSLVVDRAEALSPSACDSRLWKQALILDSP